MTLGSTDTRTPWHPAPGHCGPAPRCSAACRAACVCGRMGDFDLKKLEKELESAVEVEAKRQRIDDVKKHAIHSTASYEEFRQVRR